MSAEDIRNRKRPERERLALLRIAEKQAADDDSGIDFSDIPRLTDEQLRNMVRLRDFRRKIPVSVRLDPKVVDWLKSKGGGHLTRINDILMNLMEAETASRRTGTGR
ncbi:MAG TPA: BrnA antitoxin family protein [Acidobacteriaceae bacterium]